MKVVARRTGLSPDVIRAWEKRYEAVVPGRSQAGQRLYSDHDTERLVLLARAVGGGRRISDVAGLSVEALQVLVQQDETAAAAAPTQVRARRATKTAGGHLQRCLAAVEALDEGALEAALSGAAVALSGPLLRIEVLLPLLREVGDGWRRGTLRIVHEHLVTAIVRSFLGALRNAQTVPQDAPELVATTPAGQLHELGALMTAASATEAGWRVTYLGPNLPAEEIAAAVEQKGARALTLSLVHPENDPRVHEELRRIRRYVGPSLLILIGGQAASSYADTIRETGAVLLEDLADLPFRLEEAVRTPR